MSDTKTASTSEQTTAPTDQPAKPHWRERARSSHRQQGMAARLREILGLGVYPDQIRMTPTGSEVVFDQMTFRLNTRGDLELELVCEECSKPQPAVPIDSFEDVTRAVAMTCQDCHR